jgi:hypothetical protein
MAWRGPSGDRAREVPPNLGYRPARVAKGGNLFLVLFLAQGTATSGRGDPTFKRLLITNLPAIGTQEPTKPPTSTRDQ